MNTTTKMRSAQPCALFVRLPQVDRRLLAPVTIGGQGRTLSVAPFSYTTFDAVRSLPGRPPV